MKILMCNSFYYMRGGSERYMFELTRLLEKHGHEIIPFSMIHPDNLPSNYSDYFVSHIDYPALLRSKASLSAILKVGERLLYSSEAQQKIRRLILETKPDVAHIHGVGHEISLSILNVIKSYNIPIVQTLHDYGLLCPNTNFISHGRPCERCKGQRYYNVVLRRCKRDSFGASLLACLSHYANTLTNVYGRNLDIYISPSKFLKKKLAEYGVNKKVVVIPNFIDFCSFQLDETNSGYCLYAGRLLAMKGVRTLIEAAKINRQARILIAGDGELANEIRDVVAAQNLNNVRLLGYVESSELAKLIAKANFTVFPSECYENYPMSIIESYACGKPVIASNIGAIPELVTNGWNGLLFEPGNPTHLATQIQYLFDHPDEAAVMGRNGRDSLATSNDPEVHYQQVMGVYRALLDSASMAS